MVSVCTDDGSSCVMDFFKYKSNIWYILASFSLILSLLVENALLINKDFVHELYKHGETYKTMGVHIIKI